MLATVLMVLVLGMVSTMTTQWLRNWDHGFIRIQRVSLWAMGLDRLMADLGAAEVVTAGSAKDKPTFDGTERSVTFVRTSLGPNVSTGLEVVRIADVSDERGPALVRWTSPFGPDGDPAQAEFSNPVVMMRMPYPIVFSYAGPDRVWREAWHDKAQLPRMIRVEVPGDGGRLAVSTSTFVRAELPARCTQAATTLDECLGIKPAANANNNGASKSADSPQGQ